MITSVMPEVVHAQSVADDFVKFRDEAYFAETFAVVGSDPIKTQMFQRKCGAKIDNIKRSVKSNILLY